MWNDVLVQKTELQRGAIEFCGVEMIRLDYNLIGVIQALASVTTNQLVPCLISGYVRIYSY